MDKEALFLSFFPKKPGAASRVFKAAAEKNTALMRTKTVREHRDILIKMAELRPRLPGITIERADCPVPANWVYRENVDDTKIIMYIHGGSWMLGNLATAQMPAELLAESLNCRVLVVEYRLSPEHPFPAGFNDCRTAFDWLLETGYAERDIALFGDSAGGNLSLALLHSLKSEGRVLPAAAGLASPVTDMTADSEIIKSRDNLIYTQNGGAETDIFSLYVPDADRTNPLISPVFGELRGFPPIEIHAGGDEPLVLDCIAFAKKAYAEGVNVRLRVCREMFHDFTIVGIALKESRESIKYFTNFFAKHLL